MKHLKLLSAIILMAVSFVALIGFIWALIFYSYYSAFLAFLGLLVFIPIQINNRRFWLIRAAVFTVGITLLLTTINVPIGEVNNRISLLAKKPRTQSSISTFSIRDKLGIYGLNLMMGIFAYPIYPEVSKETIMMVLPAPKNGIRTFHSDFAIKSYKIRKIIKDFRKVLITDKDRKKRNFQKQVYWSGQEYSLGHKEARYALALNPCGISLKATKNGANWIIDVNIRVNVRYPPKSYVTLLSKPELKVEEGLFWILQQSGWLFPYTAEWEFTINSNDERIK